MRTITIERSDNGEKRELKIRPLKRKEIKELAPLGYQYLACVPTFETAQEAMDKAIGKVLTDDEMAFLDECDNKATKTVWESILKETYGDKAEEKNLQTTTDGTLTKSE